MMHIARKSRKSKQEPAFSKLAEFNNQRIQTIPNQVNEVSSSSSNGSDEENNKVKDKKGGDFENVDQF
jgi:hypothetical protein